MASIKYTKMWILLSEYNFQVESLKYRDLICCICKSLLKNAQQSICGCAFCFECIKNYLATDEKYCPGRSNGCKELMTNIERNMQIDHAANKKVANVIVTCPMEFCDFKTELKFMDEHIESHDDNSSNHGKFLREPLEKLKKEISSLRDDLQLYKKDSLGKELMIMKIRDEIDNLRKTNDAVRSELSDLKEEFVRLAGDCDNGVRNNNSREVDELDEDIDWVQLEIFTDEVDADLIGCKKRRIQEPMRNKGGSVSSRITKEIRDIVAVEVKRNTETMRAVQNDLQEEIRLLKVKLQNAAEGGGKQVERIDLCAIEENLLNALPQGGQDGGTSGPNCAVATIEPAGRSEGNNGTSTAAAAVSEGRSTRRKLRRELPRVKLSPSLSEQDQHAPSKPSTATKTPATSSSSSFSSSNKKQQPLGKPLHPLTLLRLDQKEKRAAKLLFAGSRSYRAAFNNVSSSPLSLSRGGRGGGGSGGGGALKKRMERRGMLGTNKNNINNNLTASIEQPLHWMRNVSPFEFRIDKFADKHLRSKQGFNSNAFSQPFFSAKNGYKMCLRIDFDPMRAGFNTHLGVFFCLLRGEFDDHLPWPMKLEVTISIIDQITFSPYTSRTFDYASAPEHWKYIFHRPTITENQLWFGTPQFVHFDFIFNNPPLLLNDSILIRCSVSS